MYERFTERARKVMQLANQEAQRLNHEYIGTEHILLGLVKEGSGVGANVLKSLGVDLPGICAEVEKLVQSGPESVTKGKLPMTPRAKSVIKLALEESQSLNHEHVGTEHLLLGLLRDREGVAAQVLMNLGLRLEAVRLQVLSLVGKDPGAGPQPGTDNLREPPVQSISDFSAAGGKTMAQVPPRPDEIPFDPTQITRPDWALMKYYAIISLLTGPAFPITLLPLLFKYETLKYRFDESGVSMSWGVLWRREIYLTYRRIQDIHLTRNIIQRWMGLATVAIQTASGSAGPEMSIEGVLAADQLRDYLYAQMRGARGDTEAKLPGPTFGWCPPPVGTHASWVPRGPSGEVTGPPAEADEALALLREIRDLLRRLDWRRGDQP
jgi:membrane protein YdbS with pleckstrin-like domain